jgi:protein-S-isoprenylcysteine O-methyltransferase Ste14
MDRIPYYYRYLYQLAVAERKIVNPLSPEKAKSLVDSGIFSVSRNPMYVGLLLISAGWALWLGSLANIAVIALFVFVITNLQIKPEEDALAGPNVLHQRVAP